MSDYTSAMNSAQHEANFVRNMKRIREEHGWSQGELARRMTDAGWEGFHQTTISRIEKGERPVRLSESSGIATALNAMVNQMILPGEGAVHLRDLERQVEETQSRINRVVDDVEQYMFEQSLLKQLVQEVESNVDRESLDAAIADRMDQYLARAKNLIETGYLEQINGYLQALEDEKTRELGRWGSNGVD